MRFLTICLIILNIGFLDINQGISQSLNQQPTHHNLYTDSWFNSLQQAWEIKNLSAMNTVDPLDLLLINMTLGDVELYIVQLPELVNHINTAFNNNVDFQRFKVTNNFAYNLFRFISYLNILICEDKTQVELLLSKEFNSYEIVSLKRLTEVELSSRIQRAQQYIIDNNITNQRIDELAGEFNVLYIEETSFEEIEAQENPYNSCIHTAGNTTNIQSNILNCNSLHSNESNKKENLLLGIRACYIHQLQNHSEMNETTLHNNCLKLVSSYRKQYPQSIQYLDKHIRFLIYFFPKINKINSN